MFAPATAAFIIAFASFPDLSADIAFSAIAARIFAWSPSVLPPSKPPFEMKRSLACLSASNFWRVSPSASSQAVTLNFPSFAASLIVSAMKLLNFLASSLEPVAIFSSRSFMKFLFPLNLNDWIVPRIFSLSAGSFKLLKSLTPSFLKTLSFSLSVSPSRYRSVASAFILSSAIALSKIWLP